MTTLKEELADVVSRINVLEQERNAKLRQEAMSKITTASGLPSEDWDFITHDQLDAAVSLATKLGAEFSSRLQSMKEVYDDLNRLRDLNPKTVTKEVIKQVGHTSAALWKAVTYAFTVGVLVGALIMYLLG